MASFLGGLARGIGGVANAASQTIQGYATDKQDALKQRLAEEKEKRESESERVRNALLAKQTDLLGKPVPREFMTIGKGQRLVDPNSGKVIAEGAPADDEYTFERAKGGKLMRVNKKTLETADTGIVQDEPTDFFARFAEQARVDADQRAAADWQRIYVSKLNPTGKYETPMSVTEAAAAADEAMGGRPRLAPKVGAQMGTSYTPLTPAPKGR